MRISRAFLSIAAAFLALGGGGDRVSLAAGDQTSTQASVADDPPVDRPVAQLAAQIRGQETRFDHLDVLIKRRQTRKGGPQGTQTLTTSIVVRNVAQGDMAYIKLSISRQRTHLERVSAFDGKLTRTVETGNSANVHHERTNLARIAPPHSWPLDLGAPLSDFLARTGQPKGSRPFRTDSLAMDAETPPQQAINPRIDGEETLNGLACVRVTFDQEDAEGGAPPQARLWLARDRHWIPAKWELFSGADRRLPTRESHVDDWWEVEPNVWLPKRITRVAYEPGPSGSRQEREREVFAIESPKLHSGQPPEFFEKIETPRELPSYEIKDGRLADHRPSSVKIPDAKSRLEQLADRLRKEESLYERLSVDAAEVRVTSPLSGGISRVRKATLHSVLAGDLAFHDARHIAHRFDGTLRPMLWMEAYDGQTYRSFGSHPPPVQLNVIAKTPDGGTRTIKAKVGTGGVASVSAHNLFFHNYSICPALLRPHSALLGLEQSYRRLGDVLWPQQGTPGKSRLRVDYAGEERLGGFNCHVLSIDSDEMPKRPVHRLLWLAQSRNLIPVRCEIYMDGKSLPSHLNEISEFRELKPGVWYPASLTRTDFREAVSPAVRDGFLFVQQTTKLAVKKAELNPSVEPGTFGNVFLHEGTLVQWYDSAGELRGKFTQPFHGAADLPATFRP